MAFMRYANATLIHPRVFRSEWSHIRVAGKADKANGAMDRNLVTRASDIFGRSFNPEDYLLTHATIIASVDVVSPPGTKTGSVLEDGFRVNRKYADYRVKPASDKFINNNMDAWSRGVILKSYPTFIGAHNFVEHVQIEELSKGRIIDAVARDIGDSVYVDILIATNRANRDLIAAIENGKMGTLSMGCTVDGTVCTKCGHWAADETELCPHIKYQKGNTFFDNEGRQHRIAELCGHESLDPHGGVQFIEGSWVLSPAFTGAVLRNIIEPTEETTKKAQKILSLPPPQWASEKKQKAAFNQGATVVSRVGTPARASRIKITAGEDFLAGWGDESGEGGGEGEAPAKAPEKKSPFTELEDETYQLVIDKVRDRLNKDVHQDAIEKAVAPGSSTNETAIKLSSTYRAGLRALLHTASSDVAFINGVAAFDKQAGINIPIPLYRAALKVGPHTKYQSAGSFHKACVRALGHTPTLDEATTVLKLSKMISQRWSLGGTDGNRQGGSSDGKP